MRKNKIAHTVWLTALLVAYFAEAGASCEQPVDKVASAQGRVEVKAYGSSKWQNALTGQGLCFGDVVRTLRWSRVTLSSAKGQMTFDQNTAYSFPPPQQENKPWYVDLLAGKIFFRTRQPQRLDVHTPYINVVHEGTEFMVAVSNQYTEISVFDGIVAGENHNGKIKIHQGEQGIADARSAPRVQALMVSPEDAVQWSLYYPAIIDDNPVKSATDSPLNSALHAYHQGNHAQALAQLETVPTAQQTPTYLTLKAALLLSVGRLDEAQPLIHQAQQLEPRNSDAYALKAIIAVAKNQAQTALDQANQAVTADPQSAVAKIAQSYAYQAQFNIDQALKATQSAVKLNPNNALAWARQSELQLSQGDHTAALNSAQQAQRLNPSIARTQTILGFANLAETEIETAKHNFSQALSLDSSDPLARLGLGLAKIRQGDLDQGKNELETAVNLDPNNAVIRSYLGKAYYELRNKDYAGKEFDLAKAMDPKDPTPYFYDAILKQTTNRPVEALHDMQKAIELNDNRGVYRSKLLLDSDSAARSASLGRIYNDLGFQQRGLLEGWNSVNQDPSNYSAHRLLADNYATLPRHEISRLSELLKAQLLQPVNITPVQPQATESNILILDGLGSNITSFNEYNPLFTRDRFALQGSGFYGSRNTISDEVVHSGVWDKFSYSLGQFHYQTDGFRQNNQQKKDIYNVFAQAQVAPDTNVQFELRRLEEKTGDVNQGFYFDAFSLNKHASREINSVRGGLHHKFSENSDLLASIVHRAEEFRNDDGDHVVDSRTKGTQYELQQMYRFDKFDLTGGLNYQDDQPGSSSSTEKGSTTPSQKLENRLEHGAFYLYSNVKIVPKLTMIAGVSQDFYRGRSTPLIGPPFQTGVLDISPINPKFGLNWMISKDTTLRFAAFRALKRGIIQKQTLETTQIAGFNQFFDDPDGTVSTRIGLGIDHKFNSHLFVGAEFSRRNLEVAYKDIDAVAIRFNKTNWNEENARAYVNWTPNDQFALGANYSYEGLNRNNQYYDNLRNQSNFFTELATHKAQIFGSFYHPSGFISKVSLSYVNQSGDFLNFKDFAIHSEISRFWLLDTELGYRLPNRHGLVSLGIKNLLNEKFNFQGTDLNNPMPVQGRYLYSRLTLSF